MTKHKAAAWRAVHICAYVLAVTASLGFVLAQINVQKTERIAHNAVTATVQSLQANLNEVEERLFSLSEAEITLPELELLGIYMANAHDDLFTLKDHLGLQTNSRESERAQANVIGLYYGLYRYISYVLPSAAANQAQGPALVISEHDRTKLEFIYDVHAIMHETSDEFLEGEQSRLDGELADLAVYFSALHGKLTDYLEQNYQFRLPESLSSGDSILEMLFD